MVGSYVIFYCNQYIQNSCAYVLKKVLNFLIILRGIYLLQATIPDNINLFISY
jgi:hypothetical protein